MQAQWFETWFDSPWYPILYRHRDHAEAEAFIRKLLEALAPGPHARFLDLACGRGRHSVFIHQQGHDVTGLDLSPASIADAQAHAGPGLRFGVHDMRMPLRERYDFILNLFTSFGYFSDLDENQRVLRHVADALLPGGRVVLDFMNADRMVRLLVPSDEVERDGIRFSIRKHYDGRFIVKRIQVHVGDEVHDFEERVQALRLADFEQLARGAGLRIAQTWGDYAGGAFDLQDSPRLILFMEAAQGGAQ